MSLLILVYPSLMKSHVSFSKERVITNHLQFHDIQFGSAHFRLFLGYDLLVAPFLCLDVCALPYHANEKN